MVIPPGRGKGVLTFDFVRPPDRRFTITSTLLEATEGVIVTAHELSPSKPLQYAGETVLDVGHWAVWFLFKNQPYDVGRVYRPDGAWTGYYVDILEPVRWEPADPPAVEPIVDLFLDLWIGPDGRYAIIDEDEFDEAVRLRRLSADQADGARRTLRQLVQATSRGEFPPAMVRDFRI